MGCDRRQHVSSINDRGEDEDVPFDIEEDFLALDDIKGILLTEYSSNFFVIY